MLCWNYTYAPVRASPPHRRWPGAVWPFHPRTTPDFRALPPRVGRTLSVHRGARRPPGRPPPRSRRGPGRSSIGQKISSVAPGADRDPRWCSCTNEGSRRRAASELHRRCHLVGARRPSSVFHPDGGASTSARFRVRRAGTSTQRWPRRSGSAEIVVDVDRAGRRAPVGGPTWLRAEFNQPTWDHAGRIPRIAPRRLPACSSANICI